MKLRGLIPFLTMVLVVVFLLPACLTGAAENASEAVKTAPQAPPLDKIEELVGEISAMRKVALATKVAGRLEKVKLFAGDAAKNGETIANLETRDFELAVAQAQANLDVNRAKLKMMETGSRPEEKKASEEQAKQAKANMENAQSELQRTRDLFTSGAVSKQALDAAEAKAKVTEAQYSAAIQQKTIVDKGPRIEDKEGVKAQVRQLEAALEMAKLQLEYAFLKAPFDGAVAMRQADEGAYVNSNTPVYYFIQLNPVFAIVECPERLIPLLGIGTKAKITIDALPGQFFDGTLERIPPVIDSKTRSAKMEFVIQNPNGVLRPGMFARAVITLTPERGQ